MQLKPYPEYKDSGVSWLGQIPVQWRVMRIKNVLREVDQRNDSNARPLLSLTRARGLVPFGVANDRIPSADDFSKYKVYSPGQLVMNRMQAWSGMFGATEIEGLVSPDYSVFTLLEENEVSFFENSFKTPRYVDQFAQRSKGIGSGFNRLYTPDFGAVQVAVPSTTEQQQIVRFVDLLDCRIRRFVRAKRRLIELLNEQKQAIIHQAVTRGLDPNVRLKPSGVDWLGDIPEHWDELAIRQFAESLQTGPFGSQLHAHDYVDGGVPVINPSHLKNGRLVPDSGIAVDQVTADRLSRHKFVPGDIVFARRGELGRCGLVYENEAGWICGTGCLLMRPRQGFFDLNYLMLVLSSQGVAESLRLRSVGATMNNLNESIVAQLRIPCPPMPEQRAILSFASDAASRIDEGVYRAQREIDLIREYRTRLIADVVTGKLDVRHIELPEMDEVDMQDEWDEEAAAALDDVLDDEDEEAADDD